MDIVLRAFSGVTGEPTRRIPYTKLSWSDSLNEAGSMDVTLTEEVDAESLCAPWRTILAAFYGDRILHAGYVEHLRKREAEGEWEIDVGGGLSILDKRLVLNPRLATAWVDGRVKVDEEHPSGNWQYTLRGSYSDIIRGLINDTINTWGKLPITVAASQGGSHERNYNSFDYATIYDRIHDITELEDGVEVRLDPELREGKLTFIQRTATEIIDNRWRWNATVPGSPVAVMDSDIEGEDLCSQSYASGGREKDMLLVARAISSTLPNAGYPVMQIANKSHSSVSEQATLKSYVNSDVQAGNRYGLTRSLRCDMSVDVKPGDWADVRTRNGVLKLKVTDVSGSLSNGYLTVQACDRY